jgi:D-alanyl-D-alanine carboxypeptidase
MVAQGQIPVIAAQPVTAAQPAAPIQPSFAAVAATSMATATVPRGPAVQQASAAPQTVLSDAPAPREASERSVPATIATIATAAVSHLAPVSKAEAAPVSPEPGEAWGIQVGAFRAEAAAERVEHEVVQLGLARGKQPQILAPAGGERLYRARLLYFTAQAARAACGELRKQHIDCSVVPVAAVKVASR